MKDEAPHLVNPLIASFVAKHVPQVASLSPSASWSKMLGSVRLDWLHAFSDMLDPLNSMWQVYLQNHARSPEVHLEIDFIHPVTIHEMVPVYQTMMVPMKFMCLVLGYHKLDVGNVVYFFLKCIHHVSWRFSCEEMHLFFLLPLYLSLLAIC